MKNKTLYLHIGWSKTGTSAVQEHMDANFDELLSRGILYSRKLQMNDHAHHYFALAYNNVNGYPPKYNELQVLDILDEEMNLYNCDSCIISSELSPFYFNNQKFSQWAKRFDNIKVIATVRKQSEVVFSLFNQLVKDPQVRYSGTIFQLTLSNLPKLNYYHHIQRWAEKVGDFNINIINYDDGVIETFLNLFELEYDKLKVKKIVNPSLPSNALRYIQRETKNIDDPLKYAQIRDSIVKKLNKSSEEPKNILISKDELKFIDQYYLFSNNMLAKKFTNSETLFATKQYYDVYDY